jgi:hypothetical protein
MGVLSLFGKVEKLWRYGKINGIFREKQQKTLVPR